MSETDEIIGSAEPMESEMLSDNLQLIVGSREYIYRYTGIVSCSFRRRWFRYMA